MVEEIAALLPVLR